MYQARFCFYQQTNTNILLFRHSQLLKKCSTYALVVLASNGHRTSQHTVKFHIAYNRIPRVSSWGHMVKGGYVLLSTIACFCLLIMSVGEPSVSYCNCILNDLQHTVTQTKWPEFRKRCLKSHFRDRNICAFSDTSICFVKFLKTISYLIQKWPCLLMLMHVRGTRTQWITEWTSWFWPEKALS